MSVVIAILVVLVVAVLVTSLIDKCAKNDEKVLALNVENFRATQQIISADRNVGLALDENGKKVCLVDNHSSTESCRVLLCKDLLSSEIFQDGETITSSVRSSDIGSALVGGFLFGGAGAVVGGLSGKTKSSNTEIVHKISLRLIVNDTKNPLFEIDFLNTQTNKKDLRYQDAMQKARHWHGLIEVLIKRADVEDKENTINNVAQGSQGSTADEIKKLAELRDAGVLSDAEFQQQKERLLT